MFFLFINKTLRLSNLKTRTAMNAKVSVFLICVEAIIFFLLYNLYDSTFTGNWNRRRPRRAIATYFGGIYFRRSRMSNIHVLYWNLIDFSIAMRCAIWYYLYNLKNAVLTLICMKYFRNVTAWMGPRGPTKENAQLNRQNDFSFT